MGVGLSILIGLKAAILFSLFAFLRSSGFTVFSIPFLYTSLVSALVSLATHPSIDLPMLLGKNPDGSFPIWSIIMFSPYLYFVHFFSALRRLRSMEASYTEICEGFFVGGWPSWPDKLPPRNPEFSGHSYLCVAT
ncbi:hypothetical protein ACFX15_043047 [Malus domestica]